MVMMMMMIINNKTNRISMTLIILSMNMAIQSTTNSKMSYMFMGDLLSFWITDMTMVVMYILMFMEKKNTKMYFMIMNVTTATLVMTFYNWNFMTFYILFEMSMIMILLIIMSWGYQPERTEAIMFMVIMTLTFSLPTLAAMMMEQKSMNFWHLKMNVSLMVTASFMLVFMVKLPSYFVHFWLPKAHVEAPVQGSMILAAIMLKLGCYGIMRMEKMLMNLKCVTPYVIGAVMWSSVILSMKCIMQIDLKTMIAYSSIVHMTMVLMNIMMTKTKSMFSSLIIMIGHGLCSASLFFMINVLYETSKSRSIMINKGMMPKMTGMMMMWFIACMNNAPMPPSMNMLGELISFKNMISWSGKTTVLLFFVALTSSMYSIYMFYLPTHGKTSKTVNTVNPETSKTLMIMTAQVTPIMLIMTKPQMLIV